MTLNQLIGSPDLQKAAVTFATGYARRMMEGQYTRLMETDLGKQASRLSRPSKYAVEAVLNGITAYLATKESTLANTPIKQFLAEVAKDAPSEISKRLLNGMHSDPSPAAVDRPPSQDDERTVLDGLLRMDANELGIFLSWLDIASPAERQQMAEVMSRLTEVEQRKLLALTPEQARTLLGSSEPPPAPSENSAKSPGLLSDLARSMSRLNEQLERRRNKEPDVEKGEC